MKYTHIISAFVAEPWAMQREKLHSIVDFLAFKSVGGEYSSDELASRISNQRAKEVARREGSVAVIPVHGVLMQRVDMLSEISGATSYEAIKRDLRSALANDEVKAVILDIDSPGGSVPGTEELAAEIRSLRGGSKPIIAQVNSLAASAAYWIASSATTIVATPSARVGSIGVYTVHEDFSAAYEKAGIKPTYIFAGKYKVEGNDTEPLNDEAKEFIQARVDESYKKFVSAVADGRSESVRKVENDFGQGRVFGADMALELGMVDEIATLDETLAKYGADPVPDAVRKIRKENTARAEMAKEGLFKLLGGDAPTEREVEAISREFLGASRSQAENAGRALRKTYASGEASTEKPNDAILAALKALEAKADGVIYRKNA